MFAADEVRRRARNPSGVPSTSPTASKARRIRRHARIGTRRVELTDAREISLCGLDRTSASTRRRTVSRRLWSRRSGTTAY